ncbi:TPA: DUF1642 domain-containing protein [Streptococcus suis]|nr:DUF1642 domain-containing protein [Streptococcus suis]
MNKQEAIEIIEQSKIKIANRERTIFKAGEIIVENVQVDYVPLEVVVNTIDQIHEPQTVVVPKYIADKIEYCKDTERYGLFHAMDYCYQYKDSADWLECNEDIFARAWLDGYEIEREKLYTVEIPDPNCLDVVTFLCKENGKVFIGDDIYWDEMPNDKWKNEPENQLTESEIKKDFEWAWDAGFAKEVEEDK